ncbi:hypothetical protein [Pelagicoccus sp. SDUM812005]|uniref:hypothetical protein n=1 Tax=Pelagicoccus sp. SDUM812005 TaxID=3041257 RepID=UPI00280FAC85|nr:hypothetical protein [Pelagicoccus sp. SDUM812005]MDQ8182425.1 hypothetical protein [Pelagicoccus sp. SDUM812005]
MNRKDHKLQIANFLGKSLRFAGLMGLLLAMVGTNFAKPVADKSEARKEVTIWVDDIQAAGSFRAEDIREELLRQAFADAARREKWLGDYEFEYNGRSREPGQAGIELKVIDWRRGAAGMYSFTVAADYWNADGEKTDLGTFHGMRSGIMVVNGWDVGEQFAGSAEDAFRDALRKLKSQTIES